MSSTSRLLGGLRIAGLWVLAVWVTSCSDSDGFGLPADGDADVTDTADVPTDVQPEGPDSDADPALDSSDGDTIEPEPATEALGQLEGESETPIELNPEGGVPGTVSMDVPSPPTLPPDPVFRALNFLARYADVYRLEDVGQQLYLNRVRYELDRDTGARTEAAHVHFAQRHRGLPVFDAELAVHLAGDRVVLTNGRYLPSIPLLPGPTLDATAAIAACRAGVEGDAARTVGRPSLLYFNLALVRGEPPRPSETRLAWRVDIAGFTSSGVGTSWQCFVDSHTGELLMALDDLLGHTSTPDLAIHTAHNGQSSSCWDLPSENWDSWFDESGETDYPGPRSDAYTDGSRAFDLARTVYDFYFDEHHRHSWDGLDGPIEIMVHAQVEEAAVASRNASYLDRCHHIRFGDGYVALDVLAHEWAHAIDASEADLLYAFQSGALDESFADVSAMRVDGDDFLLGEDLFLGDGEPLRDFAAPTVSHLSDYRPVSGPPTTANDNGGVHLFSGIPNRVAYLLLEGGDLEGYEIAGLGREKAGALYYAVWVYGVTANATFRDTRDVMVAFASRLAHPAGSAEPLYAFTDSDVCDVKNAWAAVGVAVDGADSDCDGVADAPELDGDRDWSPDSRDNCPALVNYDQTDADEDGLGDACDDDLDGDGIPNVSDACPNQPGDTEDACTDTDGDGWRDALDNCVAVSNPSQQASDDDEEGDACDEDDDGDSVADTEDDCPQDYDDEQGDRDGDGVGDICDDCPGLADADQVDCDGDGLGAACDDDEIGFDAGACSPPWLQDVTVRVNPQASFEIAGCEGCPPWLPPDFEITLSVTVPSGLPASIEDDRGRLVALGEAAESQTLSFRPRPSFHYRTSEDDLYQGIRYFAVMPGEVTSGAYEVTLRLEHSLAE